MLCDLAGAVEAESFVEGLCVHSHCANGTSSSLSINYEHLEMFLTIPLVKLHRSEATHVLIFLFEVLCVQGRFMLQPLFIDLYFPP